MVEVAFHDAASHKRVPLFSDFRDFCMASLGPKAWPASDMFASADALVLACTDVKEGSCLKL